MVLEEGIWVCSIFYKGCEEILGRDMAEGVKWGVFVHKYQHGRDDCVVDPLFFC